MLFGAVTGKDPLYESVSNGRRYPGIEHWLPLFHSKLQSIFQYLPGAIIFLDHLLEEALEERFNHIADFYQARVEALGTSSKINAPVYRPIPPSLLFLDKQGWDRALAGRRIGMFSAFDIPKSDSSSINLLEIIFRTALR